MYVYIRTLLGFAVGHYTPDGAWYLESYHPTADAAAARVHWLNGGRAVPQQPPPAPDPALAEIVVIEPEGTP